MAATAAQTLALESSRLTDAVTRIFIALGIAPDDAASSPATSSPPISKASPRTG